MQRRGSDSNVVAIAKFKQLRRFVGDNGGTAAALVGSYETVAERILALWEAGIELFILQFHPFEAEMERFAHEVAPRIQALTSGPQLVNAESASAIIE
jgi:alkanesulfonate monooxygenase